MGRSDVLSRSPSPAGDDDPEGDADLSLHIVNEAQLRNPFLKKKSEQRLVECKFTSSVSEVVDDGQAGGDQGGHSSRADGHSLPLHGSDVSFQSMESSQARHGDLKASSSLKQQESSPEDGELKEEAQAESPSLRNREDLLTLKAVRAAEKKRKRQLKKKWKKSKGSKDATQCQQDDEGKIQDEVLREPETLTTEDGSVVKSVQPLTTEDVVEDSAVMRKLLRGRRYFDPPDEEGGACYNCGQVGHLEAECPEERRPRPCFICGDLGHAGWECPQKKQCYACGVLGHIARACPNKHGKDMEWCIRCGDYDHDLPSCRSGYHSEDLKLVKCYVCNSFGHLSCKSVLGDLPTPVSCCRCGELGHSREDCRGDLSPERRGRQADRSNDQRDGGRHSSGQERSRSKADRRWNDEKFDSPGGRLLAGMDELPGQTESGFKRRHSRYRHESSLPSDEGRNRRRGAKHRRSEDGESYA